MYQHVLVGDVQTGISVSDDSISGTLKALDDWLWDPFDFHNGTITNPPYHFIALDFSDNDFDGLESVVVTIDDGVNTDLLSDSDKIVIFEIRDDDAFIVITQSNGYKTIEQMIDLSNLVLSVE